MEERCFCHDSDLADGAATKSSMCPRWVICKGWSNCTHPPKAACAPPEGGGSFRLLFTTLPS